eukprot:SAG22_NODE_4342_length_1297_cov_1.454925_3_plen_35_part_01
MHAVGWCSKSESPDVNDCDENRTYCTDCTSTSDFL